MEATPNQQQPIEGPRNKAERLALAGAVAPTLRNNAAKAKDRKVAKLDKDGNVVGYTTLAKVQEALLAKEKIELAVQDGVRPKKIFCETCGVPFAPPKKGFANRVCRKCREKPCVDCGKPTSARWANETAKDRRCMECYHKKRRAPPPGLCTDCGTSLGRCSNHPHRIRSRSKDGKARCLACSNKYKQRAHIKPELLSLVLSLKQQGLSLSQIAERLLAAGFKTRNSTRYSASQVSTYLRIASQ